MARSANNLEGTRASAQQPWLQVQRARHFLDWLQEQRVSLALTTYQTGKLFLVGRKPDRAISVFERTYSHCMGMWAAPDGQTVWLSPRYQIWRLLQTPAAAVPYAAGGAEQLPAEAAPPSWCGRGHNLAYIPRVGYTTGRTCMTWRGSLACIRSRSRDRPTWARLSETRSRSRSGVFRDDLALALVRCPDPKFRNPEQAVALTFQSARLQPGVAGHWTTLREIMKYAPSSKPTPRPAEKELPGPAPRP